MSLPSVPFSQGRKRATTSTSKSRTTTGNRSGQKRPQYQKKTKVEFSSSSDADDIEQLKINNDTPKVVDLEIIQFSDSSTSESNHSEPKKEVNWASIDPPKNTTTRTKKIIKRTKKPKTNNPPAEPAESESSEQAEKTPTNNEEPDEPLPTATANPPVPKKKGKKVKIVKKRSKKASSRSVASDSEPSDDLIRTPRQAPSGLPIPPNRSNVQQQQNNSHTQKSGQNSQPDSRQSNRSQDTPEKLSTNYEKGKFNSYTITKDKAKQFRMMQDEKPIFFFEISGKIIHVSTQFPVEEGTPSYTGFIKIHQHGKRFTVCSNDFKENDDRSPEIAGLAYYQKHCVRIAIPIKSPSYPISKARNLSRLALSGTQYPVFSMILPQNAEINKNNDKNLLFFDSQPPIEGNWMPNADPTLPEEIRVVYAETSSKNRIFKTESGQPVFMVWKTSAVSFSIKAKDSMSSLAAGGLALACII